MQNNNLPKAQTIKDATMVYFISNNLSKDMIFPHFNVRYHSDNHEGIVWYLKIHSPDIKVKTISIILSGDNQLSDNDKDMANYIITVVHDMPRTY